MLPPSLSQTDLRALYVFVTVVQTKGFASAQIALNVSASTISRQITDLETRLGMHLCQRGRSGFRLTQDGETVYHATRQLFQSIAGFNETIRGSANHLTDPLQLAVIDSWISDQTAPIIDALTHFGQIAPDATIELHSMAPDDIEYGLLDGRIALGVGVFHAPKPGLSYENIGQDTVGLYCAKGHPLFDQPNQDDLSQAQFAQRAYLNEARIAPTTARLPSNASAHQIEGIAMLILTGQYIGYLPRAFANVWVRDGKMRPVAHGAYDQTTQIQLAVRRDHSLSAVEALFVTCLKP